MVPVGSRKAEDARASGAASASVLPYPAAGRPGRIVIISASVGAGHDGAATELARRLSAAGHPVDRHDFLDLLPLGVGRFINGGYHQLLTHAPWAYQRIYSVTDRPAGTGPIARALLRLAEQRTLAVLPADTRAVVATYPGASQVLGALRSDGRLSVPALTYLTDFSVHPLWVAAGVDAHLAAHSVPAEQATALGAARVTVSAPVVNPRFAPVDTRHRQAVRERFGLPRDVPLALLVAGSWGVGPVQEAATEILAGGTAVPVVVCGRNERLAARLRSAGIEHVYGWVDDMPGLMHAADILVQNAGGLTSLEAFACGLPVVSYGCIPGHGQTNAAALHEAGVAVWIRRPGDLAPALADLLDGTAGRRQRAAGLALFADGPGDGAVAEVLRVCEAAEAPLRIAGHDDTTPRTAGPRTTSSRVVRQGAVASHLSPGPAAARAAAGLAVRHAVRTAAATFTVGAESSEPRLSTGRPVAARIRRPHSSVFAAAGRTRRLRTAYRRTLLPPSPGRQRRMAVAVLAATTLWAGAIGAGIAATHQGPAVLQAVHHGLDHLDWDRADEGPRT
ncbi:glycosyltransferase [Streptomyces sp. NPDC058371]|uniref:glycosyltransferase n=1 Tax=Streptomyces sp. NPDC058371 TaxID=3346463 RepID=UPI00364943FB